MPKGRHLNHKGGHNGGRAADVLPSPQELLSEINAWCKSPNRTLVREDFLFKSGKLKKQAYEMKIAELKQWSWHSDTKRSLIQEAVRLQALDVRMLDDYSFYI